MVRPERASLLDADAAVPDGHNAVEGTVADITYFGSHRKVGVLAGELRLTVREPAGAETVAAAGGAVRVVWPVERSVLVPDSTEPATQVPVSV